MVVVLLPRCLLDSCEADSVVVETVMVVLRAVDVVIVVVAKI